VDTVRDLFWVWGHEAGSHNPGSHQIEWNLPGPSRITAIEAAAFLDVPNLLMVKYNGQPRMPFDRLAIAMRPLSQVIWSITGAMGEKSLDERVHVFELARRFPNISGVVMDDFINWDTGAPELSVEELTQVREQLQLPDRRLNLMMTLYSHQLTAGIQDHLDLCNQVGFWVWESSNLHRLESDFALLEQLAPHQSKFLGCYLWDFGARAPMPLTRLQRQCETGLAWLQSGRIDGMIFLPSCHCDLELETVEWLRGWIGSVGSSPIDRAS
jgi:hypothetical protein